MIVTRMPLLHVRLASCRGRAIARRHLRRHRSLPPALPPRLLCPKIMDAATVRKFLCASKAPLGNAGAAVIQTYKDDARDFARRSLLRRDVEIADPPGRCKKKVGRGRCRRAVSHGAIVQLCHVHMETDVSDYNLEAARAFHAWASNSASPALRRVMMRGRSRSPELPQTSRANPTQA